MVAAENMIELRSLCRFFGRTRAVNSISFAVAKGHVFGYIGPNGAGKTTSMKILATLDTPTAGTAMVDGFSVVNDPDRVRRRVGYMPDYFGTYPNVDVADYLDFFARAYGLVGKERLQAIRRTMSFTKLDGLAYKPISGLSKGMKQRLSLGRTMIHNPSVLIMDEPAAGLDPRARIELREMIGSLSAEGKTVLISSHILTELAEMCDSVGIIEQGRLLAVGSVADIERQMQAHTMVDVTFLGPAAPCGEWVKTQPHISDVRVIGTQLVFQLTADKAAEAQLLKAMILAGFPVVSFASRTQSLEDVFLHVTKGLVA